MSYTQKAIVAYLQKHGGATKLELADVCCRTTSAISKCLSAMKARQEIHIAKYANQCAGRWNVSPVYALGSGQDAPPPAKTNCDKSRAMNVL